MSENLHIVNFAGITRASIEMREFTVLIGQQASGKSVVAKLLYFFKSFPSQIEKSIDSEWGKRELDRACLESFREYFPEKAWPPGAFEITYETSATSISIQRAPKGALKLSYSDFYAKLFRKGKAIYRRSMERQMNDEQEPNFTRWEILRDIQQRIDEAITSELGPLSTGNQLFVPAGRSFFANLENNIFSFLSSNNQLDPFLRVFGSYYEHVKDRPLRIARSRKIQTDKTFEAISESVLRGKYYREKRKDYIRAQDGRLIPISSSSSGQQETLPLCLILQSLVDRYRFRIPSTMYIEEPEAHLFPESQRSIVELISLVASHPNRLSQFFITTHSPYVLTSFNNLLEAGLLYARLDPNKHSEVAKIVSKSLALDPRKFAAYVMSDGTARSIMCTESGLIDATFIDEVSCSLALQFEQLLEFE